MALRQEISLSIIVDIKSLYKHCWVGEHQKVILKDINFQVKKSESVAIVGPSGSGKSTLLHLLGMLDTPESGHYFFQGENVLFFSEEERTRIRGKYIGFVFQSFHLLPRLTILQNVMLPLLYQGVPQKTRETIALSYLEAVGLHAYATCLPNILSGGQQQRAAIARALISRPSLILADEPTGALDVETGQDMMDLLQNVNQKHQATLVLITHSPDLARQCQRRVCLVDGYLEALDG